MCFLEDYIDIGAQTGARRAGVRPQAEFPQLEGSLFPPRKYAP